MERIKEPDEWLATQNIEDVEMLCRAMASTLDDLEPIDCVECLLEDPTELLELVLTGDDLESFRRARRNFFKPGEVTFEDGKAIGVRGVKVNRDDLLKNVAVLDLGAQRITWLWEVGDEDGCEA